MKESILDTDILSYYLKGDQHVVEKVERYLIRFSHLKFSLITYFEILNGLLIKDAANQMRQFEMFCAQNQIVGTSIDTMRIAASISSRLKRVGLPLDNQDVFIAATAIEHGLVLVTNNTKHFSRIENLEIENWKK
jgi:tRNA(fMet)-specific endonuclease VapC